MLDTLKKIVPRDDDLPERARTIDTLERFRTGKIYDLLQYEFKDEKLPGGEYIPLEKRKPSIRYGLPMIIVNDTTSLLFGEGHFPTLDFGKDAAATRAEEVMGDLVKETKLRAIMLDAAVRGSVGSVAIRFRILKSRVFFDVMSTQHLTPEWDPEEPDQLIRVTEKYKTTGRELAARGYSIPEKMLGEKWWFQRRWDRMQEEWFLPWPVSREGVEALMFPAEARDEVRTKPHGLEFVPIEWVKNLPGGNEADGACTFEPALSNAIEIDYQLSQGGRGLKYASDPTLIIKEPAYQDGGPIHKSAANALVMTNQGDAKLLEMSGSGITTVLDFVRQVRFMSLELCGGSRADPEKLSAAQSGKAMELMNETLIRLTDKLRTSYGEGAYLNIVRMVLRAAEKYPLKIAGKPIKAGTLPKADAVPITLKWPPWYAPTATDHSAQAMAMKTYRDAGIVSRRTAIKQVQHDFDIEDVDAEIKEIEAEAQAEVEKEIREAAGTRPYEYQPKQAAE